MVSKMEIKHTFGSIRSSFFLVLCMSLALDAAPVTEEEIDTLRTSLTFFERYGYLSENYIDSSKSPTETFASDAFRRAVQSLQVYANIAVTGEVDNTTKSFMTRPRCGVEDPQDENNAAAATVAEPVEAASEDRSARNRRYSVAGGRYRWNKETLTYRIMNFPGEHSEITDNQVRYDVREAFKLWSDVTPLVFVEIYEGEADIKLIFGRRVHTSVYADPAFDGEGGTLAHAFTPNSGWGSTNGDVHFDDDERFTHRKYSGINLFYTTAHEIGHALGLDHSKDRSSLMWPWDKGYIPNFRLPLDDRLGIQVIYGKNPFAQTTTAPPSTTEITTQVPVVIPPYCNTTLDSAANIRGTLMVFKNDRLWRFRSRYNSDGSPDGTLPLVPVDLDDGVPTFQFFLGIKKSMKAVYERHDGRIVFLKARKKWIFDGTQLLEGPILTQPSPNGFPLSVSAALYDRPSGLTYLFKGRKVWLYDEFTGRSVRTSLMRTFRGLHPSAKVQGAFTFYGNKFLLDGSDYYQADENNYVPNVGRRNFGVDILGCPPINLPQIH